MRQAPLRLLLVILGLVLAGIAANDLLGSVVTLKSKGKVRAEFQFGGSMTGSYDNMLSVPADRTFVVTDLWIRNSGSVTSEIGLTQGSALTAIAPFIRLAVNQVFVHTFVIGPEVAGGKTLQILDLAASSNVSYYVAGYLKK